MEESVDVELLARTVYYGNTTVMASKTEEFTAYSVAKTGKLTYDEFTKLLTDEFGVLDLIVADLSKKLGVSIEGVIEMRKKKDAAEIVETTPLKEEGGKEASVEDVKIEMGK